MRPKVDRKARRPSSGSDRHRRRAPPGFVPAWEALRREISACTLCPLHVGRTHAVIYRGSRAPWLVFVGEAPGAEEDRQGIPFVGRSGQRLDRVVATLGLDPDQFGVLNLVKCRPPHNRFSKAAARTCRPYLDRQLELLRPSVLVSLGAHALAALDPEAPRILLCAGRPRRHRDREIFPLIHPAAALRSTTLAERWNEDVGRLGAWLANHGPTSAREPS
jgi:uracil-DNA glycosylase